MSDGMNKVVLVGNLGADPELRHAANGTAILTFRMATNESFLDRNRELTERTEWHSVVVFGPRAEGLARVLMKGAGVAVEGSLRTSSYEKDGQKRYRTEVHAREICFTGSSAARPDPMAPRREGDFEFSAEPVEAPLPSPEEAPALDERPTMTMPRPQRKRNGVTRKPEHALEEMPF